MKLRRFYLLLMGMLGLTILLQAQEESVSYSLTLKEAQKIAMENNITVKNATIDVEIAKKQVWQTTAIGLPHINGFANYTYIPGNIPSFNFANDPNSIFGQLISGAFKNGWIDTTLLPNEQEGGSSIAVKNSITYGIQVNQLIFSGEYIVGLQASKIFKQLSTNALENQQINIKQNISSSYFTILSLQNNLRIQKELLDNTRENVRETEATFKVGLTDETSLDQLKINIANTENAMLATETQLEVSKQLMKIQMGLDLNAELNLTQTIDELMVELNPETDPLVGFNYEDNIQYKSMQTQEKISELTVRREQSTYLPTLNAQYTYLDKTNEPDFNFTIKHTLGISLNVPIFASGEKHTKVQLASLELQKIRNQKLELQRNLTMQAQQAQFTLDNTIRQYTNAKQNLELSQKILNQTNIKAKQGVSSSFELTQAQNQYLNSSNTLTMSTIEMLNARIALDKILNNL